MKAHKEGSCQVACEDPHVSISYRSNDIYHVSQTLHGTAIYDIIYMRRGIYFWNFVCFFFGFFLFFVASGFWLLWLLAFVAFGFCGFWLLWLLAFVASVAFGFLAYPSICLYLSIYLSIYLSFFWQLFSLLFLYLLFLLFSLQRRNQTRKQASKQARAAHLWIWCAAGGGAAPPPTPPAPRNLHFIPDTRACHENNILR